MKLLQILLTFVFSIMISFSIFSFNNRCIEYDVDHAHERIIDDVIIKFHDKSLFLGKEKQYDNEIRKILKDGFSLVTKNVYMVKIEEMARNPNAVLNRLKASIFIQYAEPNYIVIPCRYIPNDPLYTTQAAVLMTINAQEGWAITKGEGSPVIAIVDSGISATHPDLPQVVSSYSAVEGLSPFEDTVGHGTNVAGVVAAIGDNGTGVAGINWNASLMIVKIDDAKGDLNVANLANGIIWAADNGAKIISLSMVSDKESYILKDAIDHAYDKGCVIVAASGNDGMNAVRYPARYPNVLAVGASTNGTSREPVSNYGAGLDVMALSYYHTTTANDGYAIVKGASIACPQVAGLASLILAVNPNLTNNEVYDLIRQGAKPLSGGYNRQTAHGLIDIGRTLKLAQATVVGVTKTPAICTAKTTPEAPTRPR